MGKKYEKLRDRYPAYISLDQLHQICHIAKRSALYLVQHGMIPAVDTGKRTWRYKIALTDVITYLRRREQWGSMIPPGAVSSRPVTPENPRISLAALVAPGEESEVYRYFERLYASYGEVLNVPEIATMTGLCHNTVQRLLKEGEIKSVLSSPRYIVPKQCLLEFISSRRYIHMYSNSERYKHIVMDFEAWMLSDVTVNC